MQLLIIARFDPSGNWTRCD